MLLSKIWMLTLQISLHSKITIQEQKDFSAPFQYLFYWYENFDTYSGGDSVEPIEVFQILGIEQTKDERALKNAYRDKLTVTNPEDDPEGFKRLRMAYEEACRYAGTPDAEENEEAEPTLEDDTPAGQWVRGVRKVYENITDRCDVENGKRFLRRMTFFLWRKRKTAPLICFVF